MVTRSEYVEAQQKAAEYIRRAGIIVTEEEINGMDVADFGLSDLYREGAQIVSFFNTPRVSAKVIVLFPNQTLPEHRHTSVNDDPGKEETFRVVEGILRLYIPGTESICEGVIPAGKEKYYTARHEVIMRACEQLTLEPGVNHWLQGGSEGVVLYSFSSSATCALDPFTDPNIVRITKVVE